MTVIKNKSGSFFLDANGIVTDFKPSLFNPIVERKVNEPQAYYGSVIKKSIKNLIVPEGVIGFADNFFRDIEVLERFALPNGLQYIGNNLFTSDSHGCIFAGCTLPEVRIPETVRELGPFAFGKSKIGYLQIPSSIRSRYLRQFKDSCIGTLCLPKEWKEYVYLEETYLRHKSPMGGNWQDNWGYMVFDCSVDKLIFGEIERESEDCI